MTEVKEPIIEEALAIIDAGLGGLTDRSLVSSNEITNLLLDVRSLLSEQVSIHLPEISEIVPIVDEAGAED